MRSQALSLLFLFVFLAPVLAQEGDDPLPEDAPKGNLGVYLETGGHSQPIICAGFTKDDQRLVTVGKDGSIQVWEVATGKRLKKLLLPVMTSIFCAALSPDDRTVAVSVWGYVFGGKKNKTNAGFAILLMNLDDGRVFPLNGDFGPGKTAVQSALAFSHNGGQLAGGNAEVLQVWPHLDKIWSKAVHLDYKQRMELLKPRTYPKLPSPIQHVQFSPDGKQILAGTVPDAFLFDAHVSGEGKPAVSLQLPAAGWKKFAAAMTWGSGSKSLFVGGKKDKMIVGRWDRDGKPIKKYDLEGPTKTGKKKDWLDSNARLTQLFPLDKETLLVSGKVLLSADQGFTGYVAASVCDLKTGKTADRLKEPDLAEELSLTTVAHDKKLAATTVNAGRDVLLWNIADGQVVRRIASQAQTPVCVGWLKDKNRYVLAWGYETDPTHKDFGKFSKAFDLDHLEFVNDVEKADCTGHLHHFGPWTAAYKKKMNRNILEVKKDGVPTAVLTNPATGISAFSLVPRDGKNPVLAYGHGGHLQLANVNTGKMEKPIGLKWPHIHDLAPSPDGKYMAVATGTELLTIYSMESARPVPILDLYCADQDWAAFARSADLHATHNGHYAASPGGEKLMGWVVNDSVHTQATFHPASRFRKHFYRPDVLARILKEGDFPKALKAVNAELKAQGGKVQKDVELEDALPPSGFIDKVDSSTLPKITVHAHAFAANPKDPIAKMELLADGKAVFGKDGVMELKEPEQESKAVFQVELPPGAHKLTVRIYSQKTWSISTDANVSYAPPASVKLPKAKLHILAVGASEYKNHPGLDLPSPASDAKDIAAALQKQCGPPLFALGASQTLIGKNATSANVYQALKELKVGAEDVAVLYFGGHGLKEKDGGLFLLTHDTDMDKLDQTALSGKKLREELAKIPCRVILILDACHSGALGEKQPKELAKTKPVVDDLTRELSDDDCGVVVWCSAMGNQKAQVDDKAGHGLFTLCFLKALDDKTGAPANPFDHKVYLHHLHAYIFDKVQNDSGKRQHPTLILPGTVESFPLRQPPKMSAASGG